MLIVMTYATEDMDSIVPIPIGVLLQRIYVIIYYYYDSCYKNK